MERYRLQLKYMLIYTAYGAIGLAFILHRRFPRLSWACWGFGLGILVTVFFV